MNSTRHGKGAVVERGVDGHAPVVVDAAGGQYFFSDIAFEIFTINIRRGQDDIGNIAGIWVVRCAVDIVHRRRDKPCAERMRDNHDFLDPFGARQCGQEVPEIALVPIHVGFINGIAQKIAL